MRIAVPQLGCLIQGVLACRRSVQRGSGDLRSLARSSFTARTRCKRMTAVGNGLARGEGGVGLSSRSHDYVMRTAWRQLSTVLCASPSWLRHRDPCDVVGEESQVTSAAACLRRRRAPLSMRWLMSRVLPSSLCFPGRICWSGSAVLGSWGLSARDRLGVVPQRWDRQWWGRGRGPPRRQLVPGHSSGEAVAHVPV